MAFIDLHFFSESLGMQTSAYVIIPQDSTAGEIGVNRNGGEEGAERKFKCLYLLHGLSDDHTMWMRQTRLEYYARKYRAAIVMPAVNRSFYTDMAQGAK